jgi:carbon storage regulator
MLILTRRASQSVFIGKNVQVKIIEVKGGQVRLGFDAPKEVPVDRAEIRNKTSLAGGETLCKTKRQVYR